MRRRHLRTASLNGPWLAFLGSLALLGFLVTLLFWTPWEQVERPHGPLVVYCAAGLKGPVEAIARRYEEEYGVPVQLQYGGSQTLLANLEIAGRGDLFLPADDSYLAPAREKRLIAETIPLARMRPVLAVMKDNPKHITSLETLLKDGVRIAQANPDAAAIGRLTRDAFIKVGHWDELKRRTTVFKPTVNDVANDLRLGTVDAGFVWDAQLRQFPELVEVPLTPLEGLSAQVPIAVLTASEQPTAALRFARYLAAADRGLPEFARQGFVPVEGDIWSEVPELTVFAGAMLRPAIRDTLAAFQGREGVRITEVYNGCGILVAQMQAAKGKTPDVYFACDRSFMEQVSDRFAEPVPVSNNRLVILVLQGNPRGLRSLDDLARPGLRVGVGHEKQCALGVLTQETLRQSGQQAKVMKNVTVQSPTGDLLVNQLLAGSLDAVVAYVSNRAGKEDELDALPVDVPCAIAEQPVAVARVSKQKRLAGRLVEALRSAESRAQFEAQGFGWGAATR